MSVEAGVDTTIPLTPDLLVALHGLVAEDGAQPGMHARISVGVDDGVQRIWWNVRLGAEVSQELDDTADDAADAALLLGPRTADAILETGVIPDDPDLIEVYGDRDLLERFVRRYFVRTKSMALRKTEDEDERRRRLRRQRTKRKGGGTTK